MAKNYSINDRKVRIQIWDTAGEEAYRSITRSYYKSAACVFIVYDISDKKSFFDVDLWLKDCREICFKNVIIYLIGNKNDLEDKRQVPKEDGEKFAQEHNFIFHEISAKTGEGFSELFYKKLFEQIRIKFRPAGQQPVPQTNEVKFNIEKEEKVEEKKRRCC